MPATESCVQSVVASAEAQVGEVLEISASKPRNETPPNRRPITPPPPKNPVRRCRTPPDRSILDQHPQEDCTPLATASAPDHACTQASSASGCTHARQTQRIIYGGFAIVFAFAFALPILVYMGLPGHGETNDQPKTSSCVGPGLSHRISCRRTDVTLGNRWLAYQVPHGPAPPNGWPAVLVFHGTGLINSKWAWTASKTYKYGLYHKAHMIKQLLENGFAVITPNSQKLGNAYHWESNIPSVYATSNLSRWEQSLDHSFVMDMIQWCTKNAWCDRGRLAATGFSSGAYMTSRMAFHNYGMKALALQCGSYYYCRGPTCSDTIANELPATLFQQHPPTLFLHGANDALVPASTSALYEAKLAQNNVSTRRVTSSQTHEWHHASAMETVAWFSKYV